jgi:hypothetical protein
MLLANYWNLGYKFGYFEFYFKKYFEFGPFFPWKKLWIGGNQIFHMKTWCAKKKITNSK